MTKYELFDHLYFATPSIRGSYAYLTHFVNLAFGRKSGFKNKCRAWARFGLQNEILEIRVCTIPGFHGWNITAAQTQSCF